MFDVAIYANQITFDGVGCSCFFFRFCFRLLLPLIRNVLIWYLNMFPSVSYFFAQCVWYVSADVLFIFICFWMLFPRAFFLSLALFYSNFIAAFVFVPWTNLRCMCLCMRIRIAVIYFSCNFFALFCFHSKLWLSRNSCVTIGIFHFYWIHNEGIRTIARSVSRFLSLCLRYSVYHYKRRTVLNAWKWLCLRVIVMLEARCVCWYNGICTQRKFLAALARYDFSVVITQLCGTLPCESFAL